MFVLQFNVFLIMRGEISRCPPFVREHPAPPWCCWCYLSQGSTTAPPLFISINRPIHFPNTPTYPFPSELINLLAFCSQEGGFVTWGDPPCAPLVFLVLPPSGVYPCIPTFHFNTPTYPFPSELIHSLAFYSQEGVFVHCRVLRRI